MNNIFEKVDDFIYKLSPTLWNLIYHIFNFGGHKARIKRFFQRIIRGWDDSDTYSLDDTFYKWLLPRLKRFKELNICYPIDEKYPTFESWDDELNDRIIELDLIIKYSYKEFNFPFRRFLDDDYLKSFSNYKSFDKSQLNSLSYECMRTDFNKWFANNINNLWW